MAAKIEAFIAEIRAWPRFIDGAAVDPTKHDELGAIERGLSGIERLADSDPAMIDAFDELIAIISRDNLSIKQRLLEIGSIFARVRDAGRTLN